MKIFVILAVLTMIGCSSPNKKHESPQVAEDQPSSQRENSIDEDAEVLGDKQMIKAPTSGDEYAALKQALSSKNDADVERAASKILSKNEHDLKALNGLAIHAIQVNRPQLARLILLRVLKKNQSAAIYSNLGITYLMTGEERTAQSQFKKALDLEPNHPSANANIGAIHLKYHNYRDAREALEQAVEKGKINDASTLANYALSLRGSGEFSAAQKYYEQALSQDSRNVSVLLNYAILLIDYMKDYKKGTPVINKLKFLATDSDILGNVGRLEQKISKM